MIRFAKLFIIGIVCSIIWMSHSVAHATTWAELTPEEVEELAEVIVLGTYDFSKEPKRTTFVFQGYPFQVEAVYRGTAAETITVGIDDFDVGWASEFQETGGTFLLFLHKVEEVDFLVPVAGPNGMIHVENNQVAQNQAMRNSNEKKDYYEAILQGQSKAPEQNNSEHDMEKSGYVYLWALPILGVILILFWYVSRKFKANKSTS